MRLFVLTMLCLLTGQAAQGQSPRSDECVLIIDENAPAGTVAGSLATLYPHFRNFRLADRSRTLSFLIDSTSGQIVVREGARLNFERRSVLALTIMADDRLAEDDPFLDTFAESLREEGISSRTLGRLLPKERVIPVRIVLRDVAEAPQLTSCLFHVDDSSPEGTVVGTVTAHDQDQDDFLQYAITGGNELTLFAIDSDNGLLTVALDQVDSETSPVHLLQVCVTDKTGFTADASIEIQVLAVDQDSPIEILAESPQAKDPFVGNKGIAKLPPAEGVGLRNFEVSSSEANENSNGESKGVSVQPRTPQSALVTPVMNDAEDTNGPSAAPIASGISSAVGSVTETRSRDNVPPPALSSVPANDSRMVDRLQNPAGESHQGRVRMSPGESTEAEESGDGRYEIESGLSEDETSGSRFLTRLCLFLIAICVVGFTVFLVCRRASDVQTSKPPLQDKEEISELKAETARVGESEESEREELCAARLENENRLKAEKAASEPDSDECAFDPESLFSDEFLTETALQNSSEADAVKRPAESEPVNAPESSLVTWAEPSSSSSKEAELWGKLQLEIESRNEVIADLKEKLEALSERLEVRVARQADKEEPADGEERRARRRTARDGDQWLDDPSRFDRMDSPEAEMAGIQSSHGRHVLQKNRGLEQTPDHPMNSDTQTDSESAEVAITDRTTGLRSELADLFAIHSQPTIVPAETDGADEPLEKANPRSPEESHLDSVAQYLSQLLDRSKKEDAEEAIFVDRRKSVPKTTGKWDGIDRRGADNKQKPAAKSYIESYLSEHGGQLQDSAQVSSAVEKTEAKEMTSTPVIRTPVDVQAIRQHMNSFREVAAVSVEHALAAYKIRQARGRLAWRSMLVIGLAIVAVLAIATNVAKSIHFASLNWMMGTIILLIVAELCLRVQSFRRHRKVLTLRMLEPQKQTRPLPPRENVDRSEVAIAEPETVPQ